MARTIFGWTIGWAAVCVARLPAGGERRADRALRRLGALPGDPVTLGAVLAGVARELGGTEITHAIGITGELSRLARTKREGVAATLSAFENAFPQAPLQVLTMDGGFVSPVEARSEALAVAGATWMATAEFTASRYPNALLIDVGTATTDIIPIEGGEIAALAHTDPERLLEGELLWTALRTPVEAVAPAVPLWDAEAPVAAGGFAVMADVHLWRGALEPEDYPLPTPDGRPATRAHAGDRLARVAAGDREMLDEFTIGRIAATFAGEQVAQLQRAIGRMRGRHPQIDTVVVNGPGAFIATEAARPLGLPVVRLTDQLEPEAARAPAAVAVGWLLSQQLED